MNHHAFSFAGQELWALPNGALWWPGARVLVVSDLHLGKSERIARRTGGLLPPYETADTLQRLQDCVDAFSPDAVISLGDSFDDNAAALALPEPDQLWLTRLQAGRHWIWITGNHDPAPVPFGGVQLADWHHLDITFRHIAQPGAQAEISGHYHPKARLNARGRRLSAPCFLVDDARIIMPAFGTYTGGLWCTDPALMSLMDQDALAILTGHMALPMPMPRAD